MTEDLERPDAGVPFFVVRVAYNSLVHWLVMFDLFDSWLEHKYLEEVVLAFPEAHLMVLVSRASFERRVVKIVEDNLAPAQAEKRVDNWHQR